VFEKWTDPQEWAAAVRKLGYSACYCPLQSTEDAGEAAAYARAAQQADLVIAEVGAWSNPISPDEGQRRKALALCKERLALADEIGARCCVNITGSRSARWDGPSSENLTPATFDMIVESTREIIDAVRPTRTFYTLETMPWAYPDSADSYLALIEAVDRPALAVHLDPTNLVCSPQRFYAIGALIRECFEKLGPLVKSCHAKDIALSDELTTHLSEVRAGLGGLDYEEFLRGADRLGPDLPVMLEHLPTPQDYEQAAAFVRSTARKLGVQLL
jgi:sugar phosphate isomerase/epimerase